MKIAEIQFTPWDKVYNFNPVDLLLELGNYVVVETSVGIELGRIVGLTDKPEAEIETNGEGLKPILRKATKEDLELALDYRQKKNKILSDCKGLVKRYDLPMKLVDAHLSFDGNRLTFAFIANGRVDFRDLLKDLIKHFKKNIRLQQIGIRDEIKINGDIGCCGHSLCCQTFYRDLGNVTSDLADLQQVAHRGADRLSGVCGRLKCCLTYEKDVYQEYAALLPTIGTRVRTDSGRGEVIGWHILKHSVDVLLDDKDTIIEVVIKK
jgi:cell fate regulator YaaT (PSP1 superfamily)